MSIEKRGPGAWRVGFTVHTPTGSEWRRVTIHVDPDLSETQQRKRVEKALRDLMHEAETGIHGQGSITVRQMADIWLSRHVDPNLSEVTAAGYRHLLQRRILPSLGDMRLSDLTPGVLADFLVSIRSDGRISQRLSEDELSRPRHPSDALKMSEDPDAPLSARTVGSYFNCLNQLLKKAVQWDMLPSNPMDKVDRPKVRTKPVHYLTDDQTVELLRLLRDEPDRSFRCAVLLALTCGLRLGEVGALTWQDVDWRRSTINISKAQKYTPDAGNYVGTTKTESSERIITIPAYVLQLLEETKAAQDATAEQIGDRWRGSGRIVCSWDGAALHHDTPSKQFRKFVRSHGYEGVRFHDLRHTHATLLFSKNIDVVAIASRLGHAKADTTLRIYAHAIPRRDQDSADAMQSILAQIDDSEPRGND